MAGEENSLNQWFRNQLMARANANTMKGGPVNVPGSSQPFQAAIAEGRPTGTYKAPPAQTFGGLNEQIPPQGQPRGYSGMQWSAPTFSEVAGLGPQGATPDLTPPTKPAGAFDVSKMGQPPKTPGFWDNAWNTRTTAGTTPMEEAGTLGKLAGAARGLSAAKAVTGPVGVTAALAPLAAYAGQKELPASYARGHSSILPPATQPVDRTGGTPFSEVFDPLRKAPAAPAAPGNVSAENRVNVYSPNRGWSTYDVSPGAPIGKVIARERSPEQAAALGLQQKQNQAYGTFANVLGRVSSGRLTPARAAAIKAIGSAEPKPTYPTQTLVKPPPYKDELQQKAYADSVEVTRLEDAAKLAKQMNAPDAPQLAALAESRRRRYTELLRVMAPGAGVKAESEDELLGLR